MESNSKRRASLHRACALSTIQSLSFLQLARKLFREQFLLNLVLKVFGIFTRFLGDGFGSEQQRGWLAAGLWDLR